MTMGQRESEDWICQSTLYTCMKLSKNTFLSVKKSVLSNIFCMISSMRAVVLFYLSISINLLDRES